MARAVSYARTTGVVRGTRLDKNGLTAEQCRSIIRVVELREVRVPRSDILQEVCNGKEEARRKAETGSCGEEGCFRIEHRGKSGKGLQIASGVSADQ